MDITFETSLVVDLMAAVFGLYLGYLSIRMYKSGKVSNVVVPQEQLKLCSDEKRYIAYVFPAMLGLAIICVCSGTVGILADTKVLGQGIYWKIGVLLVFLLGLGFFAYRMRKGKQLFFNS